jgi:hypothetical protein
VDAIERLFIGSRKNVARLKYMVMAVSNQNYRYEEIKREFNSLNTCNRGDYNLLSFRTLLENVKIKIYKAVELRIVLHGRETCSISSRETQRLWKMRTGC